MQCRLASGLGIAPAESRDSHHHALVSVVTSGLLIIMQVLSSIRRSPFARFLS